MPLSPRSTRASLLALGIAAALLPLHADARDRPRLIDHCARDACLATFDAVDSDRDGVSDEDEKAAGTDPHDPSSTPKMPRLLALIAMDHLPSFQEGRSVLVVLPTAAPNGLPLLGGKLALPGRQNTLARLGLRSDMLGGLDLANGLAVARASGPGQNGKPPVRVGGIDMALISAGSTGTLSVPGAMRDALNHSPNHGGFLVDIANGGLPDVKGKPWGSSRLQYDDGSVDEVSWFSDGDKAGARVQSYDSNGRVLGNSSHVASHSVADDGVTTDTSRSTSNDVRTGDSRDSTTTTTTSADGSMAFRDTSSKTVTHGPGGTTTTTSSSSTSYYEDGKWVEGTGTTVTTTCQGDSCKTSVTHSNGGSSTVSSPPTACDASKDACDTSGSAAAYVAVDDMSYDPTNDLRKLGFTPAATVNTALAVAGGNITFVETPLDEISGDVPPSSTPEGPLVIYVDNDPASNGGTTFMGVGDPRTDNVPKPRIDPNLPDPARDGSLGGGVPGCRLPGAC
jgi:hypothetical protein